jgi:hypothetical protein
LLEDSEWDILMMAIIDTNFEITFISIGSSSFHNSFFGAKATIILLRKKLSCRETNSLLEPRRPTNDTLMAPRSSNYGMFHVLLK